MMKLLLLPFRVVFFLLRAFFFPWYLRWIFRMHWSIYFVVAIGIGTLAYQEHQTYLFNQLEAELQIADGPPDVIPLSKWSDADNAPYNDEVTIRGIYFAALGVGEFDPTGLSREFILLADDQGREIKAVLVAQPQDIAQLQRQLAAQGTGDRIPVTVNGVLNTSSDWETQINAQLRAMNIPTADDVVVVEPFIGNRADAISDAANKTFGSVLVFGSIAGLLAFIGILKFLFGMARRGTKSMAKARKETQRAKQPVEKPQPGVTPEASPWGTFQPTAPVPAAPPKNATKPKKKTRRRVTQADALPVQPQFKSVFPGGGLGFRFKSADEIVLQFFGTLSTVTARKHDN
ncbi:MAG: hypothetical protein ACSHWY_07375 [Octadecabacter sp.]